MSMTTFILIIGLVLLTLAAINEAIVLLMWLYEHYNRRRTWTELTDRELEYCVNDVRCLVEAKMQLDGDNLYTTTAAGGVNNVNGEEKQ